MTEDQSYRMTYERLPDDTLLLRVVGKHDELKGALQKTHGYGVVVPGGG